MTRNVAFIPVRGGSKSIPHKNIKDMAGQPLVYWIIKAAQECPRIDEIYVATDSDRIAEIVRGFLFSKVTVIGRSAETATDTASTESVMLEFAREYEFDNIVLIQATSPMLTAKDISGGFDVFEEAGIDSVLSVVRQKRFVWRQRAAQIAEPVNYDVYNRPRRQEFDGFLVENGAFYITSRTSLLKTENRVTGNIGYYEMPPDSYYEIDEPLDWRIVEQLLIQRQGRESDCGKNPDFSKIKMFLTDCDGCLTDGGMYYSEKGDEIKKFNTRDGYALELLRRKGIITGVITSEDMRLNERRAEKLHIDELVQGARDKASVIQALCEKHKLKPEQVLFVGDDINDLEALKLVGISCCPYDASELVKRSVVIVTDAPGGRGVIREIADKMIEEENEQM